MVTNRLREIDSGAEQLESRDYTPAVAGEPRVRYPRSGDGRATASCASLFTG